MRKLKILYFSFTIIAFLCLCSVLSKTGECKDINTATWWQCASLELNIRGATVLIDPYFPFYRKANAILVTHDHGDHCHPPTIKRIIEVSGDKLNLIIGPKGSEHFFDEFEIKEKHFADRGQLIKYADLTIETVPSYEGLNDIGYIIRDTKTGLSVMHMGDNNRYTDDFLKISSIDYLFLSIGKMTHEDTLRFIKAVRPRYLIPVHYIPTKGAFLPDSYNYPSPQDPERYIGELKRMTRESGIKTTVLIFYPGQTEEITHQE